MSADLYLQQILQRHAVDTGPSSPVRSVQTVLQPLLSQWANQYLGSIHPSGSFAKGTANKGGTDIDLFISLLSHTAETLSQIHDTLFTQLQQAGYTPRRQNVSISIRVNGYAVDLVPGKQQGIFSDDHSLYRRKADTWTKTNVVKHIRHVINAGHQQETRILKLWRNHHKIDFPSFYLELTVIDALVGRRFGALSDNVWHLFHYLRDTFPNARVVDPANTNNIISDDLTAAEKQTIKTAAARFIDGRNWENITA